MRHGSALIALGIAAIFSAPCTAGAASDPASPPRPLALPADGIVRATDPVCIELPRLAPPAAFGITVRLEHPERNYGEQTLGVRIVNGGRTVSGKDLHAGDGDFFVLVRGSSEGAQQLEISEPPEGGVPFEAIVHTLPGGAAADSAEPDPVVIETEPNDRWEDAVPFQLGQTVFASADDRPYIVARGQDEAAAKAAGTDWYCFTLGGSAARLAFLSLDVLDREVPVDVSLFRIEEGQPVPYGDGFERFEPERSTRFAGLYKFIARRIEPGTYYVRVRGNHPAYQLRSETYPVPPYDPQREGSTRAAAEKAVRVAMDYIVQKGDSWHANTPRVGGIDDRVHNVHAETAQCIACHPTHFSTRAEMFAIANGYPVRQRPQLLFLTDRLYNNPRPFYGHPGAVWARMISASANVLSRLSMMLSMFEHNVSGEQRTRLHQEVAEYLKLYYKERNELPADESNGNQPLVSAFEVATHSWMVFDELYRRSGDAEYARWRDRVRKLIVAADAKHIKNMADLCFETIALCRMDRDGYAERIRSNVERILSYQRPNGEWPMGFGDGDPPAEFQTGHCLYTLALAGVPADDPRIERAIRYLLGRQHAFGGWFDDADPKQPQPYENFRTPFAETQFAIMGLAQYFPASGGKGWQAGFAAPPASLDAADPRKLLAALDQIWQRPSDGVLDGVERTLEHDNPLVREAAAACLGRVGNASAVPRLAAALGDPSKLVRRAAAWALRQLGNRGLAKDAIATALRDDRAIVRRGALRVFAQHFRFWTDRPDIATILTSERMADEDPVVRMLACRALWQWWYWDADEGRRGAIEDAFLARMAREDHPWVQTNLAEGFYNICDDNTRYLYNNWIALLGTPADRDTATRAHHASGTRQAQKIAAVLERGDQRQVRAMLQAMAFFPLRSGTYATRGRFSRIGNDTETIQFYSEVAPELKMALAPWLRHTDETIRGPALLAAYTLRGTGSEDVLGLPYLRALGDDDPYTRGVAAEFYAAFLPQVTTETEPALAEAVTALLASPHAEARGAALQLIARLRFSTAARQRLAGPVREIIAQGPPELLPQALPAVAGLPALHKDFTVLNRVAEAIRSSPKEAQQAAVRLALEADAIGTVRIIQTRLDALFACEDTATRQSLLELAQAHEPLQKHPRIAGLVSEVLATSDSSLRSLALDLVRKGKALRANAAVRASLADLLQDPNERTRQLAESLYSGKQVSGDAAKLLDYAYFRDKVLPVFVAKGPGGKACVDCHHNHGILKLTAPADGGWTDELVRDNYRSALKVVNLSEPEKSLLLLKPLGSADSEGVVGSSTVPHGGERRWSDGAASSEYRTILSWINGARDAAAGLGTSE